MTDEQAMEAKIRGLENECRALRATLRDNFAAAALQGVFAGTQHLDDTGALFSFSVDWYNDVASHCYVMADAMVEARKS